MKSLLHLIFGACLLATSVGAQTPQLKSGDSKKLAKAIGPWMVADMAGDAKLRLDARDGILKALEGLEKKKISGPELYSYLDDWERAMQERGGKYPRAKGGKITVDKLPSGMEMTYWVPSNYKPKKGGVPLVLFFGEGSEVSADSIAALPAEILENCAVAPIDLTGLKEDELFSTGRFKFLSPVAWLSVKLRLDRNRVFVLAGGKAAEEATRLCSVLPHIAGGLSLYGDYSVDKVNATNLNLLTIEKSADLAAAASWVMQAPDRDLYPTEINFELEEAQFPRCFWIQVKKFDPPEDGEIATVKVVADRETNTITITGDRVYQIEFFVNDRLVDLSKPITLNRNGQIVTYEANPSFSTLLTNVKLYLWDTSAVFPAKLSGIDIPVKE